MSEQENTDESVNQSEGSISNVARAVIHDKSKGYIIGTLLALSILVNISSAWLIYTFKTETRLKEYDLDWFKSQDFAQLKGEVSAHDKLITMLQIRKECMK